MLNAGKEDHCDTCGYSNCDNEQAINIFNIIKNNGLYLRQIPLEIISERDYCNHTRIPKHAGWWMCKKVNNDYLSVKWNEETDNLAPTLEESVALWVKNNAH